MALRKPTGSEREQYLSALTIFGPEARAAGEDALRRIDENKPLAAPQQPADAAHAAAVEKFAFPAGLGGGVLKVLKCALKCAPFAISQDWPGLATCMATCLLGG